MGFTPDDKKLKRAGLDYWHLLDITYYDSTSEFFEKNAGGEMFFFTTKGRRYTVTRNTRTDATLSSVERTEASTRGSWLTTMTGA